ncbi:MAG: hypothetical protein KDD47_04340 [Acidobacteria bacterium]|nr:hypothetical protein [Acidobacteriota bacterium]
MGTLVVVGTGIASVAHTTLEAKGHMEQSDKLLYVVTDPVAKAWLHRLNPSAESLSDCYQDGRHRRQAYRCMTDRILSWVRREGVTVCAAFYGHPGVFVDCSHAAVAQAREEGFEARMLPGVSAEDCLFADLGFDPAKRVCQTFEATDFLLRRPRFDPGSHLVIWQIGVIGDPTFSATGTYRPGGLGILRDVLLEDYPEDHETVVYVASQYATAKPLILPTPLGQLGEEEPPGIATLYVAPHGPRPTDPEMVRRLGMEESLEPA